ncbi:sensor histidine kinase [Streptosporangium lutulentum]|uniref:histidine kinase n=1 Tax=Streptosporangium lutulentum TaxID=1461250 RepID=A0ABT9QTF5_9ACTN|nr:histidine kinase [Streptosporangium lutulentum]MDP9850031.1 signal transduction histidine kinase [Streptosporangium lutulentum]
MDLVATLLALAAMIVAFAPRVPPEWPAATAGAISIAITVAHPLTGRHGDSAPWMLAEVPPLLVLTFVAVRHAPAPRGAASAGLAGGAVALMLVRVLWPGDLAIIVGACAAWSLLAIAAAGAGLYVRMLDNGRRRAVTEAKRAQRLILARDLHDFVAHDVSGILVQAQAAQLAPGPLPAQVTDALRRIEAAGLRALAAMDRTVQMLHEADETRSGAGEPLPGVDGLARLVDGYSPSVRVDLSVEPGLERRLSQETSATVYRVVTEALTNVRRHACEATSVGVTVARVEESVRVRVTDDGGGYSEAAGRGGFGLVGLTERVGILGGSLSAGPQPGGWRVEALVPAHPHRGSRDAGARVSRPTADLGEPA